MSKKPVPKIVHEKVDVASFIKLFNTLTSKYSSYQLFDDFLELTFLSCAYGVYRKSQKGEEMEKRYQILREKFTQEEFLVLDKLSEILREGLREEYQDFLGSVFHGLELHNKYKGQFFTPYNLCLMMAQITTSKGSFEHAILEKGYMSVDEPSVGAGANLIAMAEVLNRYTDSSCNQGEVFMKGTILEGSQLNDKLFMKGTDIDRRCVYMSYIQLSILDIPASIIWGNTLTQEIHDQFYTFACTKSDILIRHHNFQEDFVSV
jgi:type I restriction-modification system DNA methylase subunit